MKTAAPFAVVEADEELIACSIRRADKTSAQSPRQGYGALSVAV
jgi:hypothetical protein